MEARLTMVFNGIARCMAPSGPKKALSYRAVELALQGQCERDSEVVSLASQERVQLRPHPERSSERFGEQHEIFFDVTKISCKDQSCSALGIRFSRVPPRTGFNSVWLCRR